MEKKRNIVQAIKWVDCISVNIIHAAIKWASYPCDGVSGNRGCPTPQSPVCRKLSSQ